MSASPRKDQSKAQGSRPSPQRGGRGHQGGSRPSSLSTASHETESRTRPPSGSTPDTPRTPKGSSRKGSGASRSGSSEGHHRQGIEKTLSSASSGGGGHTSQQRKESESSVASGSGQPHPHQEKKKPTTKAERRAQQEAQRKAKAERLAAAGKGPPGGSGAGGGGSGKDKSLKDGGQKIGGGGGGGGRGHGGQGTGGGEEHHAAAGSGQSQKFQGSSAHPHHHQYHHHHHHHGRAEGSKGAKSKTQENPAQRQVQLFSHLPQFERDKTLSRTLDSAGGIHPAIVKLGLQYSEGILCGSNARCIALLAAFKKVVQDYTTPPHKELRFDLNATIKPYINFLTKCRPLSVSMGNAITHLKFRISSTSPELPESEAKESLLRVINDYIQEKILLADEAISQSCIKVINDGDVILVHAHSSIVQKCLVDAHDAGKDFRVIVVDSRPKMEGRECLRKLVKSGIKCSYVLVNAVSYIMKEVSKVIIGAHALLANGYVMSRIGTALIALVAKSYNVPVLVCCETYKFCDKVQTDAFVNNELGDPNDLVSIGRYRGNFLSDWKSIESLNLLNLVYDFTSPDLISMVITQLGNIPCTSVPVVLRISRDFEQTHAA